MRSVNSKKVDEFYHMPLRERGLITEDKKAEQSEEETENT